MSGIVTWVEENTYLVAVLLAVVAAIAVALRRPTVAAFVGMAIGLLLMRRVEVERSRGSRSG